MKACWGWLCATLVVSSLLAGCGSKNSSNVTIAISPTSATVLLGTSVQFIPSVTGSSNAVTWSVNGVANGNATVGTISSAGLYTAPVTRPVSASGAAVPVIFAMANSSIPNSGITGAVIALNGSANLTNFTPGNTITISGNSVAGWNGSFIILAAAQLQNGNFGVQIANPAGPPAAGVGGTATATPNITITAQVQDTNAVASAVISLDSGIRVSFAQPCTIGTGETFDFSKLVSVSGTSNTAVTWSLTGAGSIDPNSGQYTAPSTAGTATITATSVADPTETASTTVTVATAADPTIASISPPTGAPGATFQEVYLSGSNFICTTGVFVNNGVSTVPVPPNALSALSASSFLVDLPDSILSTLPSSGSTVTLTFTVQRQGGAQQSCSPSPCTLVLSPVRPAVVASSPDSIPLPSSGTFSVTLDGGYFGTTNTVAGVSGNPVVNVQFNGQTNPVVTFNSDRQIVASVPASDVSAAGLYPITIANKVSCPTIGATCGSGSPNGGMAAVNIAVQPTAGPGSPSTMTVGTSPSSVAIDTARGVAVVANQGSNDITLLGLGSPSSPSLSPLTPSLCTGSALPLGSTCTVASGPTSVAVDNIRKLALVANNASQTLAVVNTSALAAPSVTALLSFPSADASGNPISLAPRAVGINPVSGRALVAFTSGGVGGSNAGAILDLTQSPPAVINVVNLNNGPNPRIAVSPKLNWALATPGGAGSLSIVDLGRQTTNTITSISCSSGVVTVNTTATVGLLVGQPVLISGASPSSLNGIFPVRSVSNTSFTFAQASCASGSGGTASYALPVATLATPPNVRGVSINDETQKALLVDFNGNVPAFVFNILDQTSSAVNGAPSTSNIATAMNPLTNIGVIVNQSTNTGVVVDPTKPTVIGSPFSTGTSPVDVAIDPAANTALVVNQGTNNVSLFSLGGPLRSGASQIVQSSFAPTSSPSQTSSRVIINSSLSSAGVAQDQTMTLVGTFTGSSVPRLDGDPSAFTGVTILNGGREMTATLSGSSVAGNGPRLYALDVQDTSALSNAAQLQALQAVSLLSSTCANPAPQGVAIDATHNVAVVTEPGCNEVSLVNLTNNSGSGLFIGTGFGSPFELAVGTNPQGVAVYPQAGLAVAANAGSNSASIVDVVNHTVPTAVTTDPIPTGVAIDLGTGKAVVAANGASLLDTFTVSTTAQTPTTIGVQQEPSGVAIDQKNHVAVVANSSSNTASVVDLTANRTVRTSNVITFPQGVAFDPISGNFSITSGASNQVFVLNPVTLSTSTIRVGIDPSSIAYNFESGTLVTANNLSGTMTIVDFIDQTVRGVFSLKSSTQFAVAIHPQTNLAVVADTADNQLLLVPLPH